YSYFSSPLIFSIFTFFFFQAEDGIRDRNVTGVQTCALPIFVFEQLRGDVDRITAACFPQITDVVFQRVDGQPRLRAVVAVHADKIGRASCRERVEMSVGGAAINAKKET